MKGNTLYIVIGVAVVALLIGSWYYLNRRPATFDQLAQCVAESGAKFYGAFWCPHCAEQKKLFGRSDRFLPYIECSTQDRRGQLPICNEQGIQSYPTWIFADGEKASGVLSLENLSEKTNCPLPQ